VLAANEFSFHTGLNIWIISGFRTRAEQLTLDEAGRPTAPDELSTHRSCPATGVDISLGFLPRFEAKVSWGVFAKLEGLRWGGGSPLDESGLIPTDWPHVDLGPRSR